MISAKDAVIRLKQGNQRFVSGSGGLQEEHTGDSRRQRLVDRQHPYAIVLGCSDSRVPPEIIFDQGLGELFVVRVAGNVAAPSQIASIEFAAEHFGSRLVVVLGHSNCGAVKATLEGLEQHSANGSSNLDAIIEHIRPAVEPLLDAEPKRDPDTLLQGAVRANVRVCVDQLRHSSSILETLIERKELVIVGAEYSLESGVVEFFDDTPI